jgi:hypothetical protein
VLPPNYISWAIAQPENVFNPQEAYRELNSISFVLGDDKHMLDTWPGTLVKTELIKRLDWILPAIQDEIGRAIDVRFGVDSTKWVEIPLDTVRMVVAQIATRYNVGTELCKPTPLLQPS